MQQDICPRDGQTLEWHMKYWDYTGQNEPRYFGDILGCGFISPLDRSNAEHRRHHGDNFRVPTNRFSPEV